MVWSVKISIWLLRIAMPNLVLRLLEGLTWRKKKSWQNLTTILIQLMNLMKQQERCISKVAGHFIPGPINSRIFNPGLIHPRLFSPRHFKHWLFNQELFNHELFNHELFNYDSFKNLGLKRLGLKHGVEAWGWKVWDQNTLTLEG